MNDPGGLSVLVIGARIGLDSAELEEIFPEAQHAGNREGQRWQNR